MTFDFAVACLCYNQGFGFTIAEVKNMTFDAVCAWIYQGGQIIKLLTGDKEQDIRNDEEKITDAGRMAGIKTPRIF